MIHASVKWVYQRVINENGTEDAQQRPTLCVKCAESMLAVAASPVVRVLKRAAGDYLVSREMTIDGEAVPIEEAVSILTGLGAQNGITALAARILRAVKLGTTEINDQLFEDEEGMTMILWKSKKKVDKG